MQYLPPALEALTEQFAKLPGIGTKTAQRLAFYILNLPDGEAEAFANAIRNAKGTITHCPVCQNLTQGEGLCALCASPRRDKSTICVVADPKDVIAMERARRVPGVVPCAPRGHLPHEPCRPRRPAHQRTGGSCGRRRSRGGHHGHQPGHGRGDHRYVPVPLAAGHFGVKITRLAYGIPVGSHLEYADDATLMRALEGRREM